MKQFFIITILTGLTTLFINSCSTDFELNAPYDRIPIIYGVLDPTVDTQYVKINRTYLANSDNNLYANVNDSLLYDNLSAKVEEYIDGSVTATYPLQEKWAYDIEDGIFYSDSQKVYYFVPTSPLDELATYKLTVDVAEEAESITAETEMVKSSSIVFSNIFKLQLGSGIGTGSGNGLGFATSLGSYNDARVTWETTPTGVRYELMLRFSFVETMNNGDTSLKYLDWNLGSQTYVSNDLYKSISGKAFYSMIDQRLSGYAYEANVVKRQLLQENMEIIVTIGNDNLNTYIELNEPSSGVVTEKPSFTNMSQGAGIFASKTKISLNTYLSDKSTYELCSGTITSGYKFCMASYWADQLTSDQNIRNAISCP